MDPRGGSGGPGAPTVGGPGVGVPGVGMGGGGGSRAGSSTLKCVFVGNIPYDATEEQLVEVFSEVGPVVSFRLVFDRDTGKPKGYGFCEYRDAETALSAMRNLNNFEMNGRTLRVDFAENDKTSMAASGHDIAAVKAGTSGVTNPNEWRQPGGGPQQPPMPDPVSPQLTNTLQSMTPQQLYEVLSKMKTFIASAPDQARQLLMSNPALTAALLHAQVVVGMVTPNVVQQILQHGGKVGPQPGAPPGFGPNLFNPGMNNGPMNMPGMGPGPMGNMGMGGNGPMGNMGGPMMPGMGGHMNMNPMGMNPMGMGPMGGGMNPMGGGMGNNMGSGPNQMGGGPNLNMNGPPLNLAGLGNGDMQEKQQLQQLIQQVMSLGPAQIENLPPQQRMQVIQLKQWVSQNGPPR